MQSLKTFKESKINDDCNYNYIKKNKNKDVKLQAYFRVLIYNKAINFVIHKISNKVLLFK